MRNAILGFCQQFAFEPEVKNPEKLGRFDKFSVLGTGGSNLVPDLLKIREPSIDIIVHRNYGLPHLPEEELSSRLLVASSYSGNTEETIDALEQAVKKNLSVAAVSKGGQLIEFAKKQGLPYIQLPDTGIQPRAALGFQLKAILKIMARKDLLAEAAELSRTFHPEKYEKPGKKLAEKLKGRFPIIYSSAENLGLAYNWKIKFNETGKIPAFYNVFPELNHNEMTGFDIKDSSKKLSEKFYFIFLKDEKDHPKIQKRMAATKELYEKRGLPVEQLELKGGNVFHKIFSSLVLADWAAFYTAEQYGLESEQVPMVEEFKKLI